jgi:carbon-monoxide dehydrogenase large subunit
VPAFSNAVNDAFAKLGGVHTQMPHTAPRVWAYAKELGLTG